MEMFSSTQSFDIKSEKGDRKSNGCVISVANGFVLTFLAVAIAVGVGVIVYFTTRDTGVCQCGSNAVSNDALTSGNTDIPQVCSILAKADFQPLCGLCSMSMTTTRHQTTKQTTTKSTHEETTTSTSIRSTGPVIPPTSLPELPLTNIRLPTSLIPVHYNIRIRPEIYNDQPQTFNFTGEVHIWFECASETDKIILHKKDLILTASPEIMSESANTGSMPFYKGYSENKTIDFLAIHLSSNLKMGAMYVLHLQFQGMLSDDWGGLYKSSYQTQGKTVYLAFTQFQPLDARRAFPCFDEPALKATFNITLERKTDSDIHTLSNMPLIKSINLDEGYTQDVYEKSAIMPTYLVAFAFTDFANISGISSNGTEMRVFTKPDSIGLTDNVLTVNLKLLDAFEVFYGMAFNLPKIDSIAVPDFGALGMENWGLITYLDILFYYVQGISSTNLLEVQVTTISHELAHMWTGNLVTMKWWDDIWLNEGITTFMSFLILEDVLPEWKIIDLYQVRATHQVMVEDGYEVSHPLTFPFIPDDILQTFGALTYYKGAAVVKMMRFFLGAETFRKGLQTYMKRFQYSNVDHTDLYGVMEQTALDAGYKLNMTTIMDTWVEQMNYPVVHVQYNSSTQIIELRQQRFLFDCNENPAKCEKSRWEIPFTYATSLEPNFDHTHQNVTWMSKHEQTMYIAGVSLPTQQDGWIIGNIKQYGYYRVSYSKDNWRALHKQLFKDHTVFAKLNRAQMIDDAWSLSRAGMLDLEIPLNMLNYLKNETEFEPWLAASTELDYIATMLEPTVTYGKLETFMVNLVKERFDSMDISNITSKTVPERHLSALMFNMACKNFIQSCEEQSLKFFNELMVSFKSPPPDVIPTVLCTAVREGGQKEWDFIYSIYKAGLLQANAALYAMGCTKRHWLQNRQLEYSIDTNKIPRSNMVSSILAVADNPDGFHQAFVFITSEWHHIVKELKADDNTLGRLILGITKNMHTESDIQQVVNWRDHIHPSDAKKLPTFNQAISKINVNKVWFEKNHKLIDSWLDSQLQ